MMRMRCFLAAFWFSYSIPLCLGEESQGVWVTLSFSIFLLLSSGRVYVVAVTRGEETPPSSSVDL